MFKMKRIRPLFIFEHGMSNTNGGRTFCLHVKKTRVFLHAMFLTLAFYNKIL